MYYFKVNKSGQNNNKKRKKGLLIKHTFVFKRTLSRYFDVTLATAQLAPTTISKVNTMVQLATVAGTLAAPVFNYMEHPALHAMW